MEDSVKHLQKPKKMAALHKATPMKRQNALADFESSAVHFKGIHPIANSSSAPHEPKARALMGCQSLRRCAGTFVNNLLRLITRSSLSEEVKRFFHTVEIFDSRNRMGWSPTRLDFLLFEFVRMFVLVAFVFHFSVRCVVDSSLWIVEPVYGLIILLEVMYKTNTRKMVNGQVINTKLGLLRDYISQSLLLDLALLIMIVLEMVKIDCGVFKLVSLVKLRDLAHIMDRFQHWLSSSKRVSIIFDIFKSVCGNFVLGHILSLALLGMTCGQEQNWLTAKELQNSPWEQKYMWAFYWATTTMLTVGFGDFTATTPLEALVLSLIEITSIIMLAYTISRIGDLVREYMKEEEQKIKRLKTIGRFFNSHNTSMDLQDRAKWCISNECDAQKLFDVEEEDRVVQELPNDLRNEVMTETYFKRLRNLPLFVKLTSSTVHRLAKKVERQMLYNSQTIIEKGTIPSALFILTKGKIVRSIDSKRTYSFADEVIVKESDGSALLETSATIRQTPTRLKLSSQGFSMVCRIKRDDLIESLKDKRLDYQTFCFVRDQIALCGIDTVSKKCSKCSSIHDVVECPKLHYVPIRAIVCLKYVKERSKVCQKQQRRKLQRKVQQNSSANAVLPRHISTIEIVQSNPQVGCVPVGRTRPRMSILRTPYEDPQNVIQRSIYKYGTEELDCDRMHEFEVYFRHQNLSSICSHRKG